MDGFRSRHVTLSCPGLAYFVYESWPMSDQTRMTFFFSSIKNLSLKLLAVKIVSAVVAYVLYLSTRSERSTQTASNKQQQCNSI